MTLMNGLALGDRALLWSDTLFLDYQTSAPLAHATKVFEIQTGPPAALATTFIGIDPVTVINRIATAAPLNLGSLLEAAENALRASVEEQPHYAMGRLLVAGWCWETELVRLFAIHSESGVDGSGTVIAAYAAQELGHFIGHAARHPQVQKLERQGLTPESMIAIADIQQAVPVDSPVGVMHGIGGWLQEVTVAREGVTVRAVKEWA